MEDKLIEILETLGYPIYRQGSMLPDEPYPNHFFTFWNDDSIGASYYDNDEHAIEWVYFVNFYSRDPELVYTKLKEAKSLLKAQGFIVDGAGHDVASDEPTHTGRGITVLYRD